MSHYDKVTKKVKSPKEYTLLSREDELSFLKNGWRIINVNLKIRTEIKS